MAAHEGDGVPDGAHGRGFRTRPGLVLGTANNARDRDSRFFGTADGPAARLTVKREAMLVSSAHSWRPVLADAACGDQAAPVLFRSSRQQTVSRLLSPGEF